MPKEILLYNPIFSFVAENFITQLEDFSDEEISVRVNSPGGSVFDGWGMVAKVLEHGNIFAKVDGIAASMTAILLLFIKNVEALSVSNFTLHRASTFSTDEKDLKMLANINKDIRAAFEKRLDISEFEKIAGITLDDFFNSEKVIDVHLNAKQALKIGLINKINKIEAQDFEALSMKFAAFSNEPIDNKKPIKMNLEKFKAEHPEIFAQAVKVGVDQEKDRTGAFLVFGKVDFEAAKKGIESGENPTQTFLAEMSMKAMKIGAAESLQSGAAEEVETPKADGEPTAISDFEKDLDVQLKK